MKALLVAECRQGRLADSFPELFGFAQSLDVEVSMLLVGSRDELPSFDGTLYFADAGEYGEYSPDLHKRLVLDVVEIEQPDFVVFMHTSYGWDLAPRVGATLRLPQITGVTGIDADGFMTSCCNGKMRRIVTPSASRAVLTVQPGAFPALPLGGTPMIRPLTASAETSVEFIRYEPPSTDGIDLTRAEVIVSAGRGVGSRENIDLVRSLAAVFGGEVGASRPVVDAGWLEHGRQVGSTGQSVAPALYVACGISGAIQHLAGIKGAGFVLAVNTDREAPIGEVADLLVIADLAEFLPALTTRLTSP
ncbi:MAG: electron transfer flavoprotein subunit alpha/FixB family protein [Chlorobiaceae bacterium]|nr:electron transfer flavoprotein subunit alpha/FixB family protein [Chlorobiaceae bacterium]